jgi:chromosome segregation protein
VYLKRLQLIGFKTFAERTQIEFAPGVTAIVGPNGSGKSNIADAILWVLGEQRASAIRGAKLQDVIFSGSALRKPTGLAEVSLTVDNSDGSLPLSFDEITVTRRAYRNGEGEFFINKTPCRLKDIQELFLDTGVGRESYALVNQSEVDAVLSADPQARRPLFEEAAGIHKFRVKKREALRKLEATETNLVRIRDIVREIERQLGPLEAQAEVAIRYNAARERLESLEKNYLIAEIRQVDASLELTKRERAAAAQLAAERTSLLNSAEDRSLTLAQSLAEADNALDDVRARRQAALSRVERLRSDRELAAQRAQGIAAQTDLLKDEIDDLQDRLDSAALRLKTVGDNSGDAQDKIVSTRTRVEMLDAQRRDLLPRIAALRKAEETRRTRAAERDRSRMTLEAELAAITARAGQSGEQEAELTRSVGNASVLIQQTAELQAVREAECGGSRAALQAADLDLSRAELAVQEERDALASTQADLATRQAQMASVRSRLQTLEELEAAHEGYYSGVRAVMQASERGRLTGEYTVVADSFTVPVGLDVAFEVALGGSVQDIIVESESQAKAAIDLLKREHAGRATFLPLSRIRTSASRPDLSGGLTGCLGCAADLARFDPRHRDVIEMLLGRVLVCDTIDGALAVAARARGWSKVVTLAGEVLFPNGAIAGGSSAKASGSLLHRKTEIAALTERTASGAAELSASEQSVSAAQSILQRALKMHSDAIARRSDRLNALNTVERGLEQVVRDLQRLQREHSDAEARLAVVRSDRARAEKLAAERKREILEWDVAAQVEGSEDERGTTGDPSILPMLVESEQKIQEELTLLRIELASAQEKMRGDSQVVELAQSEIGRLQMQRARRIERLEALALEAEGLRGRAGQLGAQDVEADTALAAIESDLSSRQELRRLIAAESLDAQAHARALSEERSEARTAVQAAELKEAKLQMQYSQSAARLLEEYDIAPADALGLDETPFVAPDTPREVGRLRRELRSFGDVNASAAVEYAELRARYDTMSEQQQDAEIAKDKVLAAIREIDDSTRGLFMASFYQVGAAFEVIFQRLMGGGHTELSLTDPDNLLETGVEIAVQAPGKKKQNLLLLSGGERALTAVALLFAFLKVRPAPFCVLDEVDAPLDGVNVERFANLLRDFGKGGQFLIITHNPSTMEAARCWYGVTMQEPGVSRVLSMEAPSEADATRATMEPMSTAVGEAVLA